MDLNGQAETIEFLSRPGTYGVDRVERVDTHISAVFLAGGHAYKLKRAVRLPYLDFSTLALRKKFCEAEVKLNKRTAPEIYLRVARVTREPDGLALEGGGAAVDYVVVMRRFDQDGLFDRMAARGLLTPALMSDLADVIAKFHKDAERRGDFGGAAAMAELLDLNETNFARHPEVFGTEAAELTARSRAALARVGGILDKRRSDGFVRHCHGDLHLRNICLYEGRPTLFDAIEFSEAIACTDVLYDLAFLLMDLEHRDLRPLGNAVFNRYAGESMADAAALPGLAALPLFLSCRAGVRAHVTAEAAIRMADGGARAAAQKDARRYLDLACRLLTPEGARLIAVGGLSGTGKTTLARALAPGVGAAPGALVLRSDVIRKKLWGWNEYEPLPQEAYAEEVTARVYAKIAADAEAACAAGHSAICDAVYAQGHERGALAAAADRAGAAFTGLWLEAPAGVLERRLESRERDASDATVAVLRAQLERPVGAIAWARINAGDGPDATLAAARRLTGQAQPAGH